MRIIVGLGNPGEQYAKTRHNVGFMALDLLLGDIKWPESKKFKALIYEQKGDLYIKPQSFMNESGKIVQALMSYYGLLPKTIGLFRKKDSDLSGELIVIHDDIDIELGKYKIATDSSSGGHNGLKSIINHLHTQKFKRIRIGVKNDLLRTKIPAEKFVLQNFQAEEKTIIEKTIKEALLLI